MALEETRPDTAREVREEEEEEAAAVACVVVVIVVVSTRPTEVVEVGTAIKDAMVLNEEKVASGSLFTADNNAAVAARDVATLSRLFSYSELFSCLFYSTFSNFLFTRSFFVNLSV